MNNDFTRQAEDFMKAARDARLPENLQVMAQEGVAKSREAYERLSTAAKGNAKAAEEVMTAAQKGVQAIGVQILNNAAKNTEAAFDAAEALARAKTLPEAARLHAEFLQKQLAAAGAQTQALLELSAKMGQQTFETINAVAAKSFEQMKKNG